MGSWLCVLPVSDRILLRDVKALTLHYDRYTTSRRLDPIPQLKCVGGTAGCDSYTPKVIQCQNKGWDGYDVQVMSRHWGPAKWHWYSIHCLLGHYSVLFWKIFSQPKVKK